MGEYEEMIVGISKLWIWDKILKRGKMPDSVAYD